jgi:hypothetical protein
MEVKCAVNQTRSERRPLVSGIIWLTLGIFLLLVFNDWIPSIDVTWPVILIIIGVALSIRGLVRK